MEKTVGTHPEGVYEPSIWNEVIKETMSETQEDARANKIEVWQKNVTIFMPFTKTDNLKTQQLRNYCGWAEKHWNEWLVTLAGT